MVITTMSLAGHLLCASLLFAGKTTNAFSISSIKSHGSLLHVRTNRCFDGRRASLLLSPLFSEKKGFGKEMSTKTTSKKKKKSMEEAAITISAEQASPVATTTPPPPPQTNLIKSTELERLRSKKKQAEEDELRRIREVRSIDEFVREDPSAAVIPEKVAMRMGQRMLPFVGVPLFGTLGTFVAFWYLRTYRDISFETNLVAFTSIGFLVVGLLGITYSVMSSSWDPDREGSLLGTDEFSRNMDSLKDGLKRSRENAILRDKMSGMSDKRDKP